MLNAHYLQATTRSPFEDLPTEIVQQIILESRLSSAVCLALTSHTLYKKVYDATWWPYACTKGLSKLRLLRVLHKDCPDLYLCRPCNKFHPYEVSKLLEYGRVLQVAMPKCEEEAGYVRLGRQSVLKFQHAQALVQFTSYRPQQTMSGSLHIPTSSAECVVNIQETMEISVCVVGGQLINKISCELKIPKKERRFVKKFKIPYLCFHLNNRKTKNDTYRYLRYKVRHFAFHGSQNNDELIHSCPYCPTDIAIKRSIQSLGQPQYLITAWRDLGSCALPTNAKWASQQHRPQHNVPTLKSLSAGGITAYPYIRGKARTTYETAFGEIDVEDNLPLDSVKQTVGLEENIETSRRCDVGHRDTLHMYELDKIFEDVDWK